jgi:hypothetical protein
MAAQREQPRAAFLHCTFRPSPGAALSIPVKPWIQITVKASTVDVLVGIVPEEDVILTYPTQLALVIPAFLRDTRRRASHGCFVS